MRVQCVCCGSRVVEEEGGLCGLVTGLSSLEHAEHKHSSCHFLKVLCIGDPGGFNMKCFT